MPNRLWCLPMLVLAALLLSACGPPAPLSPGSGPLGGTDSNGAHLEIAIGLFRQLDSLDPNEGMAKIAYHLNRWNEDRDVQIEWQADPLIAELPEPYRALDALQDLAGDTFDLDDIYFLREAFWLKNLSRWVPQSGSPDDYAEWLDEIERERGAPAAFDLEIALRLFDWTVRNIQLEPSAASNLNYSEHGPRPWAEGIAGPGYRDFPWQTLLMGHGDAWQRARVFMLLLRQHEIDAVLLARGDDPSAGQTALWLPAVLIDGDLFLFDTQLGLPIAGENQRGVATLEQVREDASLLRSLELGADYRYAAARADLSKVFALIDAAPGYLARRMARLELQLSSDDEMILSARPSAIADRVRGGRSAIERIELWHVPYRTRIYRVALDQRVQRDPDEMGKLLRREILFESINPMVRGRQYHLQGRFDNEDERPGAKRLYVDARIPDNVLKQLETSPEVQMQMGLQRGRENEAQWQSRLQLESYLRRQAKQNASYWLGLIHYETANFEAAADWFEKRTLAEGEANPWFHGARYNLARTYEQLGRIEPARRLLLIDQSPQRHGNLLRARRLKQTTEP